MPPRPGRAVTSADAGPAGRETTQIRIVLLPHDGLTLVP
jgi:hypothetical protein